MSPGNNATPKRLSTRSTQLRLLPRAGCPDRMHDQKRTLSIPTSAVATCLGIARLRARSHTRGHRMAASSEALPQVIGTVAHNQLCPPPHARSGDKEQSRHGRHKAWRSDARRCRTRACGRGLHNDGQALPTSSSVNPRLARCGLHGRTRNIGSTTPAPASARMPRGASRSSTPTRAAPSSRVAGCVVSTCHPSTRASSSSSGQSIAIALQRAETARPRHCPEKKTSRNARAGSPGSRPSLPPGCYQMANGPLKLTC